MQDQVRLEYQLISKKRPSMAVKTLIEYQLQEITINACKKSYISTNLQE